MSAAFPSVPDPGEADCPRYATTRDWQDVLKNRARFKMYELIERLGLRTEWSVNKRGKAKFGSAVVKELVNDMAQIVKTLPKESEKLIALLSEPDSLKDDVDSLLSKHGSRLWGRLSDRQHLVNAGEPRESTDAEQSGLQAFYYPRDLYYEDDLDRELIRMLLHWWLGLKACNVILAHDRISKDRQRKAERQRKKQELEEKPAAGFVAYDLERAQREGLQLNTTYLGVAQVPAESKNDAYVLSNSVSNATRPQGSADTSALSHPIGSQIPANSALRSPISVQTIPPPPSIKQLGAELENLVSNFLDGSTAENKGQSLSPTDAHATSEEAQQAGLDLETLKAFRSYIYPSEQGPRWNEVVLLRRLETAWRNKVRTSRNLAVGDEVRFAARDRAFLTWIELRRHLADLRRADECWGEDEEDEAVDLATRISQHKTLMSASRDLANSWDDIDAGLLAACAREGLTAEYLLVEAFTLLASDKATPDMAWGPMNVRETVKWLRDHLEQFAAMEADVEDSLLFVRT